ncbi:hypothetical protein F7734_52060 [Scytonema sp. UIC 10036]|uniref:hypothetical protein n=1 Tax=Scytonema sp. UIC 10036 TaxID=2304196 RepID=UPI0012DACF75|nr:hypothetical protein [Scytonema sp. UIC 10036]MUH00359.1 hypothetical protein [Scytonema sp. UIC 10036]
MLLTQAISAQQALYANIEAEIQALQARQREIQSYLQTLGGIESKMESAALLVQEAIAEIKQHCPDELPAYQTLINGFFDSTVAGQIAPSDDTDPTPPAPPTPPTPPESEPETVTVDAVAVVDTDSVSPVAPSKTVDPTSAIAATVDDADPTSNKGGAIAVALPTVSMVPSMKKAELIQHLQALGMSTDGTVKDLKVRLGTYVMQRKTAA